MAVLNSVAVTIPDIMRIRVTLFKQRELALYSTTAFYFSLVLMNVPLPVLEALLYSLASYFMVGMTTNRGGVEYAIFLLLLVVSGLFGTALSAMISATCPTEDVANIAAPALALVYVFVSGYSPQYRQLPVWFRWLTWVNPTAFGFEALMLNEFAYRDIPITEGGTVVATVDGVSFLEETFGLPRVPFNSLPTGLNTPTKLLWFDIGMIAVLCLFLHFFSLYLFKIMQRVYGPTTLRPVRFGSLNVNGSRTSPNEENGHRAGEKEKIEVPEVVLAAEKLSYYVSVKPQKEDNKEPLKPVVKDLEKGDAEAEVVKEASMHSARDTSEEDVTMRTNFEYGQVGRGQATKRLLKLQHIQSSNEKIFEGESRESDGTALDVERGQLQLLSNVTAVFEPGEMTALMGESGAGKTTLMDVIAGYKTGGQIRGKVYVNGREKQTDVWQNLSGYCEQSDIHLESLTVWESLFFSARCRLPSDLSESAKIDVVNEVIDLLDLGEYKTQIVGNEGLGEGLPKHARKRLTFGVELVAKPSVMFLDEPTSGLDAMSADKMMEVIRRVARELKVTVICTIHQPSRTIFETFDRLLLLRKGGIVVYQGPIGNKSCHLLNYMERIDPEKFACAPNRNPADHALDVFCGPLGAGFDFPSEYERSQECEDVNTRLKSSLENSSPCSLRPRITFWRQFTLLYQRRTTALWRTPEYTVSSLVWVLLGAVLVVICFGNALDNTVDGVFNRIGVFFFEISIAFGPMFLAIVSIITERAAFYRETFSGTYSTTPYALAFTLAELPFFAVFAVLFVSIIYWSIGLRNDSEAIGYHYLMMILVYTTVPALGQAAALISPNVDGANSLVALLLTVFSLTMGFLILGRDIPGWWVWLYWINPLR